MLSRWSFKLAHCISCPSCFALSSIGGSCAVPRLDVFEILFADLAGRTDLPLNHEFEVED